MLSNKTIILSILSLLFLGCLIPPVTEEKSAVVPSIDVYSRPAPSSDADPVKLLPQTIAGSQLTETQEVDLGEVGTGVDGYYDNGKIRITIMKYKVHDDASADVENLNGAITSSYAYLRNGSVSKYPNNVTVEVKIGKKVEEYKVGDQVLTQTLNESRIYYLSTERAWMEWTSHYDSGFAWTKDNWSFLIYLKAPNTALRNEIIGEFPY